MSINTPPPEKGKPTCNRCGASFRPWLLDQSLCDGCATARNTPSKKSIPQSAKSVFYEGTARHKTYRKPTAGSIWPDWAWAPKRAALQLKRERTEVAL